LRFKRFISFMIQPSDAFNNHDRVCRCKILQSNHLNDFGKIRKGDDD
jgi:hypothetical protein